MKILGWLIFIIMVIGFGGKVLEIAKWFGPRPAKKMARVSIQ